MPSKEKYCCQMRQRFILGIVAVDEKVPEPENIDQFILEFSPKIQIGIKYCPFCATPIDNTQQTRVSSE